jgi:hypothetical protein
MPNKKVPQFFFLFTILCSMVLVDLAWNPVLARAADQENCMLCHRYSGLGCFDRDTGTKKIFYVSGVLYSNSVHNNVLCSHCHLKLKEVPHKPAKKVDCGTQCHVKDPSTDKNFSHKIVVDEFNKSVHGKSLLFITRDKSLRCKYCHTNPLYSPLRGIMAQKPGCESEALGRCLSCHEKSPWAERFLKHFVSRTTSRWNNKQIVDLCNNCHVNKELMHSFGLETTANFKGTFHFRNVKYEADNAANCLSCHGPKQLGFSAHSVKSVDDPESLLFKDKRVAVCGQPNCHEGANRYFASGAVHGTGIKSALLQKRLIEEGEELTQEEKASLKEEIKENKMDKLQLTIIWGIKTFYKLMIILVGGFMFIHQMLDLRITLKERREGRH